MKEILKTRLAQLLSVKSLVTLSLTAVFGYLTVAGMVSGQEFMTIFSVVIAFYFGTQSQKISDAIAAEDRR
ncbi:MAG: hypothetical protein RRY95_05150 [Oscillospiraceae bacterium]